jgi:hypothetical protein
MRSKLNRFRILRSGLCAYNEDIVIVHKVTIRYMDCVECIFISLSIFGSSDPA